MNTRPLQRPLIIAFGFHEKLIILSCFTDPDTAPVIQGVDVINSTVVKVTWSTIPKDRVHGHLKGYQVFVVDFLLLIVELISFLQIRTDFRSRGKRICHCSHIGDM